MDKLMTVLNVPRAQFALAAAVHHPVLQASVVMADAVLMGIVLLTNVLKAMCVLMIKIAHPDSVLSSRIWGRRDPWTVVCRLLQERIRRPQSMIASVTSRVEPHQPGCSYCSFLCLFLGVEESS
jgi:hypothetical protein